MVAHRVSIAKISTAGLVAATISAHCITKRTIANEVRFGETTRSTTTKRRVNMPIYVNEQSIPTDKSAIGLDQLLKKPGAEIWVSIPELGISNVMKQPCRHGRNYRKITTSGQGYEWLALGQIDESRIECMMPFDGKILHEHRGANTVWSRHCRDDWVWDWDLNKGTWVQDKALFALAKEQAEKEEPHSVSEATNLDNNPPSHYKSIAGKRLRPQDYISRLMKKPKVVNQGSEQAAKVDNQAMTFSIVRPYYKPPLASVPPVDSVESE